MSHHSASFRQLGKPSRSCWRGGHILRQYPHVGSENSSTAFAAPSPTAGGGGPGVFVPNVVSCAWTSGRLLAGVPAARRRGCSERRLGGLPVWPPPTRIAPLGPLTGTGHVGAQMVPIGDRSV